MNIYTKVITHIKNNYKKTLYQKTFLIMKMFLILKLRQMIDLLVKKDLLVMFIHKELDTLWMLER